MTLQSICSLSSTDSDESSLLSWSPSLLLSDEDEDEDEDEDDSLSFDIAGETFSTAKI